MILVKLFLFTLWFSFRHNELIFVSFAPQAIRKKINWKIINGFQTDKLFCFVYFQYK